MQQAVRHFQDRDRKFNGSAGTWTICGLAWFRQPSGEVKDCGECKRLLSELADQMRAGRR